MVKNYNEFVNETLEHNYDFLKLKKLIKSQSSWLYSKNGLSLNRKIKNILYHNNIAIPLDDFPKERDKFRHGIDELKLTSYGYKNIQNRLSYQLIEFFETFNLRKEETDKDYIKYTDSNIKNASVNTLTKLYLMFNMLVRDENGDWCLLNKLNTNFVALPELLVSIIKNLLYHKNPEALKMGRTAYHELHTHTFQ